MTLKGQYFEKIEWKIIHKPRKNNLQFNFSVILKKFAFCVYGRKKCYKFAYLGYKDNTVRKTLDSLFLSYIGLNKPKNHLMPLSL
jgi:hypothetical protein